MPEQLLTLNAVSVRYGHIRALDAVSLEIPRGHIVSIIGSNGAGKSTLLKTIMGLVAAERGDIRYAGQPITRMPTHRIVQAGVSLVPEGRQLFGPLSIRDNLLLGTYRYSGTQRKARWDEVLQRVLNLFPVLRERLRDKAANLSGGQQQMLAIARALMSDPALLLLDEPSVGLSPLFVRQILQTLVTLRDQGVTIVLVEQNARLALKLSDTCYVLETGRVCMQGPSAALLDDDDLKNAYLGGRRRVCQVPAQG